MFSENQPERGVGWRFEGEWRALARPTAELVAALAVCDGSRQNIREKKSTRHPTFTMCCLSFGGFQVENSRPRDALGLVGE